jgi:hypothetical protein
MMAAELQVWVGHLLIVGGRAVRMPPPGALAETAPKRAPHIRTEDTFFVLVTPAGEHHAPAPFFQEMAALGADTYFGSSGGITGGLREALSAIHHEAADQPVNVLAVVLRGEDVYAARGGRAFAALSQGGEMIVFPEERRDPLVASLPPLGTGSAPDIQLTHYTIAPGQMMLLGGPNLMDVDDAALRAALSGDGVQSALDALKALGRGEISASVIRFAAPGADDPAGSTPQPDARGPRAAVARTYKPASLPEVPAVPGEPEPAPEPIQPFKVEEQTPPPPVEVTPFVLDEVPPANDPHAGESHAGALVGRLSGMAGRLRPQPAEPDETPVKVRKPSPLTKARVQIKKTVRDALRAILSGLLAVTDFVTRLFNQIVPTLGEGGRQGIPTNVAVGLAVLIPVVIVIVVVGLALSKQGQTDFEVYLRRAKAAHQEAMTLSNGKCDNQAVRPLWSEVMRLSEQAEKYRPNDPDLIIIRADARNYLDCFDVVQRRDLVLLHEFARDAELVGPVVNGGIDLFTLDRKNGEIYHDTLNETGDAVTSRDEDPIIWTGQTISSASEIYTVGDLIDIEWLRSGGTAHDNVLIAIDRNGLLVAYSPTFFETAQQLVTGGRWQNPVALAVFRSNIYVLDADANQVWRYVQPAGERAYSNAPEEYFNGESLPDLSGAVDLGISDEGAIYILFGDGTVKKYRRSTENIAEEQPFYFKERPPGALTSGVALFVDNDPASASLYIVDRDNETIYETSWSGRFNLGYRPNNDPDAFVNLSGFFADAVSRNNMYVVAGNKLYYFKRN